jgi:hypothetical protein
MPRHVLVALVLGCLATALAQPPAAAVTGSGNGFLLVELPPTMGVFQTAMAEDALTTALSVRFPSASSVRCVDMHVAATVPQAFVLLFLIGDRPLSTANGSSADALPPLAVDAAALQADLSAAVVPSGGSLSLRVVSPTAVAGPLPSLEPVPAPSNAAFLRVDMSFRNLLSPRNLTQSLLFQTRRGLQTFLGLASLSQVTATGPAQVPEASVLLVTQSFWLVLNTNQSDATMDNRARLANLLIYGDPSRPVAPDQYPALFLDFAVDSETEPPVDPTVLLTLPFVFSSLSVDVFPEGNPPAPEPALPPDAVVVPATPSDQLLARQRKRHVFAMAASGDSPSTAPIGDACPSIAAGGLCVKLLWNNTLDAMAFAVESLESVAALAWNVAPTTRFCASSDTPQPLLPSPLVPLGVAPFVWAIAPLGTTVPRAAFALHLRSIEDDDTEATRVTVEISTERRSPLQAATTVTSIARRVRGGESLPPIYATRSNVVVNYDAQFRASSPSEITLALTLQAGDVAEKDTTQPCAHCQSLYEWCTAQAPCRALTNCVFRDGLEAAQVPATLLQAPPPLADGVVDVSSFLRGCLSTATDLDALLLFASAVRCQLQRQCVVRTPADYALAADDRVLLWEAGDGVVTLNATATANVTLLLLDTTLCTLPLAELLADTLDEFVARQCVFANHLGRVMVAPAAANGSSLELRFQDLVGMLPTVDTGVGNAPAVVTALPALRLRLERADFATALPPLPPSPAPPSAPEICRAKCHRLALDRCLRDLACVSFTDCITRSATENETTGDALLRLFARRTVGESLSLRTAVETCAPSAATDTETTRRAWRALVDASACLAKWDCALSLQGVVLPPAVDGDAVVGKWRFRPTPVATQRLIYEQQPDDSEAAATSMALPLTAEGQATTVAVTSSSDTAALTATLRSLLQYDDLNVTLVASATDPDGRRRVQWELSYAFWLGPLPRVVDAALAPRWRLFDMPRDTPQDVVVELVANAVEPPPASTVTSVVEITTAPLS